MVTKLFICRLFHFVSFRLNCIRTVVVDHKTRQTEMQTMMRNKIFIRSQVCWFLHRISAGPCFACDARAFCTQQPAQHKHTHTHTSHKELDEEKQHGKNVEKCSSRDQRLNTNYMHF